MESPFKFNEKLSKSAPAPTRGIAASNEISPQRKRQLEDLKKSDRKFTEEEIKEARDMGFNVLDLNDALSYLNIKNASILPGAIGFSEMSRDRKTPLVGKPTAYIVKKQHS